MIDPKKITQYGLNRLRLEEYLVFWIAVAGSPYIFERWEVGREVVLRRNENYWGPKPKLKKIVYRFILNDIYESMNTVKLIKDNKF